MGDEELFREVSLPREGFDVTPGPLAPIAERAAAALTSAKQTVTVFEATTAGLIQAALQAVPGASSYATCGASTYSTKRAAALLGGDLSAPRPPDGPAYKKSKREWTTSLARRMRPAVGVTWCISESGACGPSFTYPGIDRGFTAIFVSGPVEKGVFVESPHNEREGNMWGFTKIALEVLAECVEEAAKSAAELPATSPLYEAKEDRFGGLEVRVLETASTATAAQFDREFQLSITSWKEASKRGLWLTVPRTCAHLVAPAVAQGFAFHHAKPDYVLLTRWLPDSKSPLPHYAFTQVGCGGVVVNKKGEVLMVKEKVAVAPQFQGQWKTPGGMADPAEDFAETVSREVFEETGVKSNFVGIVSMRHTHGVRFGQSDIFVLGRLEAVSDEITIDPHELLDAQWMSWEHIKSIVAMPNEPGDGKVSPNNLKMIEYALFSPLLAGSALPNSRGGRPTMVYTVQPLAS